jgi:Fe-S-cluster containining protein
MIKEYSDILAASVRKKNDNKKFLDRLGKAKINDLDAVTNEIHDEVFSNIDCLQCANCCRTTGPLLKNRDIDRLAKCERMQPGSFTEKYLRIDEDGDYVFKSMPCPFLKEDNYCRVYDDRPNACAGYPHTSERDFRKKIKITFLNSMICPAVALIVERLKEKYKSV